MVDISKKLFYFLTCSYPFCSFEQNENVQREASSLQYYQTSRQPDRIAPHRVLTEKNLQVQGRNLGDILQFFVDSIANFQISIFQASHASPQESTGTFCSL